MANKITKISSIQFEDKKSFDEFIGQSTKTISKIIKSESSKKITPQRKKRIKILKKSKSFIKSFKS